MANTAKSDAYKKNTALKSARLTKARTEQLTEWHLMQEMGRALGIEPPKQITDNPLDRRVNTRTALTPGLTVTLSVRRSLYDHPVQYRHAAKTFIRFLAIMEAEKAARAEGLEVRFVISATDEDGDEAVSVHYLPNPHIQKPTPLVSGQPYHVSLAEKALAQARARI